MKPIHPSLSLPAPLFLGFQSRTAHLLSFFFTATYVGSIYLSQTLFSNSSTHSSNPSDPSSHLRSPNPYLTANQADARRYELDGYDDDLPRRGSRDHPDTIRMRMKAVGVATLGSVLGVWWVVGVTGEYNPIQAFGPTLHLLGIPTNLTISIPYILPYILAPTLLLGPLYAKYLDRDLPLQRSSPLSIPIRQRMSHSLQNFSLVDARNYLVGPITEEVVFRSTILSVSLLGHLTMRELIFGTPLWFGMAHAHHAMEVWRKGGSTVPAAIQALSGCAFQLVYTTLFGWFASYLYLRTGSILPPLISHIFCNVMGIYLPHHAMARHPRHKWVILATYLTGIAGFVIGLIKL